MTDRNVDEYEDRPLSRRFETGSEGIWTFVFIDMAVFCLIFTVYSAQRVEEYRVFDESQRNLDVVVGCVNTLVLLASSMVVVRAVESARRHDAYRVRSYLARGLACGLCFCLVKVVEYYGKFASGITPATNSFYAMYFFITFLHLLHVLVGTLFLHIYRRNALHRRGDAGYVTELENVGLFWHFVDLAWIVIYSLLYLL